MDPYYVEVDSRDTGRVRDALFALGDSGVRLSAIYPFGRKTCINWWPDKHSARDAARRLTAAGLRARARSLTPP